MRSQSAAREIKTFAVRSPFLFSLVFFIVSTGLVLVDTFVLPLGLANGALQALLAFGVLLWFGWMRKAGFNSPSAWRNLQVLWLPALFTVVSLSTLALVRISTANVLLAAGLLTILTGLNEEARFRGVILQALLPYGWLRAAFLSAVFFGASHLPNLLLTSPVVVLAQVPGAFFQGFGYAAFRLRTNTIWPLIIFHACGDLTTAIATLNGHGITLVPSLGIWLYVIGGVVPMLLLAAYGLFLLRPQRQLQPPRLEHATELTTPSQHA